ncbi:MAG: carbon starvation protein A [Minicystis sp.]
MIFLSGAGLDGPAKAHVPPGTSNNTATLRLHGLSVVSRAASDRALPGRSSDAPRCDVGSRSDARPSRPARRARSQRALGAFTASGYPPRPCAPCGGCSPPSRSSRSPTAITRPSSRPRCWRSTTRGRRPRTRGATDSNYHPTNKWVLFGHHFAAISGAGPLIGPVLAAQFGFFPGYAWILFGVVLGGAVQDFVILVASVRRGGRSLAEIARDELGPFFGLVTAVAILFIVVVALAGLGRVVVEALAESAWGVFTIGLSIPIALGMGLYIYPVKKGSAEGIRIATIAGVAALLLALVAGKSVADGALGETLRLSKTSLTVAIAAYGFLASVLPVWMLLCPRDYLSSYMKIGTIFMLVAGIILVNPIVQMPLLNQMGPKTVTVGADTFNRVVPGSLYPFVFITIACGAISGFHALVSSGTTPKMVDRERDCRAIGYGAMLMEGLVGITALVAAACLPPQDYFAINTDPKIAIVAVDGHGLARSAEELSRLDAPGVLSEKDRKDLGLAPGQPAASLVKPGAVIKASAALHLSNKALAALGYGVDPRAPHATSLEEADFLRMGIKVADLPALSQGANEVVAARTGGAVSLAISIARVFSGLPGMKTLLAYWYHFAIMFEALFVLTTIDTGTRIGRFLVQELVGRAWPKFGETSWLPGSLASTAFIVAGWSYFILTGSIATIWPMFGVANQLLACAALCVGTTIILREGKRKVYALVTLLPLSFVGTTTIVAGVEHIRALYRDNPTFLQVNLIVTVTLLGCIALVIGGSVRRWISPLPPAIAPAPAREGA